MKNKVYITLNNLSEDSTISYLGDIIKISENKLIAKLDDGSKVEFIKQESSVEFIRETGNFKLVQTHIENKTSSGKVKVLENQAIDFFVSTKYLEFDTQKIIYISYEQKYTEGEVNELLLECVIE